MKLFKEEKTGSGTGLKKIRIILLLFFLSVKTFSQIPINGFCKYSSFGTDTSLNLISTFNFNNDFHQDLLLISSERKRGILLEGSINNLFSLKDTFRFPFQITQVKPLNNKSDEKKQFAYISRKSRKAGVFQFSKEGKLNNFIDYEFKSFPNNISAGDINNDGKDEVLVSGSGFEGLSILSFVNGKITEKKIDKNAIYKDAILTDLNNDEFLDVAAFELLSNSIVYFYNRGDATFRIARTESVEDKINFLLHRDLNSDDYEDLLFVNESSIRILYNDFRSSFERSIEIKTDYSPDKLITGDFNQDGKVDIAYLNYIKDILSIVFAKTEFEFYSEIIYLQKEGFNDAVKVADGICGVSGKGEVFFITRFSSAPVNSKISIAGKPAAISRFVFSNKEMGNLVFIDKYDNSLKILTGNKFGVPDFFYSSSLSLPQTQIASADIAPKIKAFYCYSFNKKLVEVFIVNFLENKIDKKLFYADGNITDLKIKQSDNGIINIYACYQTKKKLGVNIFEYKNKEHLLRNKFEFDVRAVSSGLLLNKEKSIYFWQNKKDSLVLFEKKYEQKDKPFAQRFSLSLKDTFKIVSFSGGLLNDKENVFVSFVNSGLYNSSKKFNGSIIVSGNNITSKITGKSLNQIKVAERSQLFFDELNSDMDSEPGKLFIYDPKKQAIFRMDFFNKGKEAVVVELGKNLNINRYFIRKINSKNYNIVFTKHDESFITVKNLNN